MPGDYISRSSALQAVGEIHPLDYNGQGIVERIKAIPAADVVEVVRGKWIRLDAHRGLEQYKCSVCRSECYVPECMGEPMYEYCPNCGAKMDGGQGE